MTLIILTATINRYLRRHFKELIRGGHETPPAVAGPGSGFEILGPSSWFRVYGCVGLLSTVIAIMMV